jgi:hypothetical protein
VTADHGEDRKAFSASREAFEEIVGWLDGVEAAGLDHGALEVELSVRGREVLRRLLQDHLSLRSNNEERIDVVDSDGTTHGSVEADHSRALASIFGEVEVVRLAYRHRGHPNLHPADATLNLPVERHSHGIRRLAAIESARGSFGEAAEAICRATGVGVGKRQLEEAAHRAATDVEAFYEAAKAPATEAGDVVVLSVDAKGIVMRPDALRPATAKAAAQASTKLQTRLSRGEKSNRKRMAEVGAVYDVTPVPRSSGDVMASKHGDEPSPPAPQAKNKWITASVADEATEVIGRVFDEAHRRDRRHVRPWVALVDGNRHQIDAIRAEAAKRKVTVPVLVDYVHVLEYLWAAAWCFFAEGTPAAEEWVRDRAMAVLEGNARAVAAGIRRRMTAENVPKSRRKKAEDAARYLTNNADYLDYPTALDRGLPIATGIIEGTCRFLVKDRMAITGARWSVEGAEDVLKLRAVKSNGDFDNYWKFHTAEERRRNHEERYAGGVIPLAA